MSRTRGLPEVKTRPKSLLLSSSVSWNPRTRAVNVASRSCSIVWRKRKRFSPFLSFFGSETTLCGPR